MDGGGDGDTPHSLCRCARGWCLSEEWRACTPKATIKGENVGGDVVVIPPRKSTAAGLE